jgi:hypothetical protein
MDSSVVTRFSVCTFIAAVLTPGSDPRAQTFTLNINPRPGIGYCQGMYGETCAEYELDGDHHSSLMAYVVVNGIEDEGIGGLQFGIDADPTAGAGFWALCSGGAEIPEHGWPAPGTGNAITFAGGCTGAEYADATALVGFFFFSPPGDPVGRMWLIGDPRIGGRALTVDCELTKSEFCEEQLGALWLGPAADCDTEMARPCNSCGMLCAVPVREQTWSGLKALS